MSRPTVVIACMLGSPITSTAPAAMLQCHLRAGGGAVHSITSRLQVHRSRCGTVSPIRATTSTEIQVDGMNQIQTRDVELSYEDEGEGQPVVFVHGSISDCRMWNDHRGMITPQFRVIAVTQRNFGLSPWSDDGRNFSIQPHADQLAAFIGARQ